MTNRVVLVVVAAPGVGCCGALPIASAAIAATFATAAAASTSRVPLSRAACCGAGMGTVGWHSVLLAELDAACGEGILNPAASAAAVATVATVATAPAARFAASASRVFLYVHPWSQACEPGLASSSPQSKHAAWGQGGCTGVSTCDTVNPAQAGVTHQCRLARCKAEQQCPPAALFSTRLDSKPDCVSDGGSTHRMCVVRVLLEASPGVGVQRCLGPAGSPHTSCGPS